MRILITADLHYDIARSRKPARQLAERACAKGGDVLVLLGDTAGRDLDTFAEALRMFEAFKGRKLLVPGNHCLWCRPGEDSIERYEQLLPRLAEAEGFEVLDYKPVILGEVGLAGSIGWYDYSFREEYLGIPMAFYEAKVSPGAAARLDEHTELFEAYREQLTERQLEIVTRWMDGRFVKLGMSDDAFVAKLAKKLEGDLAELSASVERIAVFLHHLPFRTLVPKERPDKFAFAAAYMGSERFGEVLMGCPKVAAVYCGHSHWRVRQRIGHMDVVNVGSTYRDKILEILDW